MVKPSSALLLITAASVWITKIAVATVELSADTTFGSSKLVCPVSEVTFTCTAVGVSSLEWSRNGNLLTSFLPTSSEGIVNDVRIPDGFEIELNRLVREGTTAFANFTTTLTANVSVLMNGSDQISCVSLDIIRTIDILYDRERSAPAPLFSHTFSSSPRDGEVTLTLTWDETFTTTHAVQKYCVRSDLCPEQCVESDTPFSCPGLVAGGEYMFWVRAVNCGDQEGEESQPLVVRPQVPSTPSISGVFATYNEMYSFEAVQINVTWETLPEIHVTSKFTATNLYMVAVSSNTGEQEVMNITCDQSLTTCSASFPLLKAADYTVSISARNIVGGSDTAIYPNGIFSSSSSYYNPSISFENCITSVLCSSSLDLSDTTRCVVHYGTDPSYTLLSDPVDGPLNSMFQLPLLEPTTTYYFQTSVLINSTLTVQVQEEFTTGEFDPRLLSYHRGLIAAGAILWIITFILTVINFLLLKLSNNCLKRSIFAVLVVIATFLLIAAILWVAVGFQVGLQQNTCDLNWQRHRSGLIISAFVLSLLSLATSSVIIIILILRWIKGSSAPVKEKIKLEPPQYVPVRNDPNKKDGGFENEDCNHRGLGEKKIDRYAEEECSKHSEAAVGSDGVYDTTRHGEPPKPIPNPEDPQYSHLSQQGEEDEKGKKDDKTKITSQVHSQGAMNQPPKSSSDGQLDTGSQGQPSTNGSGVVGEGKHKDSSDVVPPRVNPPQVSDSRKMDENKDKKHSDDKTKASQATGEYEHLSHGTGQPHPPSIPGSEEYGKLETPPQDKQAAIGSDVNGVYDTTRHDEPPKPIPNPEDPQYSHLPQQEEEEKKKKDKKNDKKKKTKQTSQDPGEYQHLSHGTGQPHPPSIPGSEEYDDGF